MRTLLLRVAATLTLFASGCSSNNVIYDESVPDIGTDAVSRDVAHDTGVDVPSDVPAPRDGSDATANDAPSDGTMDVTADVARDASDAADTPGPTDAMDAVAEAGGGCTTGVRCPAGQYCALPLGMCSATGTCTTAPTLCPLVCTQVCGCDGNTYCNTCLAERMGITVAHTGMCTVDAGVMDTGPTDTGTVDVVGTDTGPGGCTSNADCASTSYCMLASGTCSGRGACTVKPRICPLIVAPVCGCDGVTYQNACRAAVAGESVRHAGMCP